LSSFISGTDPPLGLDPAQQCCNDGNGAPADTNISVSKNFIVEVVNRSITAYRRSVTGPQVWHQDLDSWLGLSSIGGSCVDPEVIWWSWDDRFAVVCAVTQVSSPLTEVAVSRSGDPTAPWCVYDYSSSAFIDQPSITATADKIAISGTQGSGSAAVVFEKSSMLSCDPVKYAGSIRSLAIYRAAVQISAASDAKFVTVGGGLWVLDASGTPNQGNVKFTETKIEDKDYATLSDPHTVGGSVGGDKLDNRFMSASQEVVGGHSVIESESRRTAPLDSATNPYGSISRHAPA
jgi:hypothetical protein